MSRSGYSDDCENMALWRGAVNRAIKGKRGQEFLKEMVAALDAMPEKKLAADSFTQGGEVCALGSVALKRGLDVSRFEESDDVWESVGHAFGIAPAMAAEIMFENDEIGATPEKRWAYMRAWAVSQIQ